MHSNIYQLSKKPIDKEEWVQPEFFYDNSQDFADYIDDEIEGDDRTQCIKNLQQALSDIFDLDGDGETLVYKGKKDMSEFLDDWVCEIHKQAEELTWVNITEFSRLHKFKRLTIQTHLDLDYRFYIEDHNSYAGPLSDLVKYTVNNMKEGDCLYFGSVIDFHF